MKKYIIPIIFFSLFFSCQKETEFDDSIEKAGFDEALQGLGYLNQVEGYPQEEITEPQEVEVVEEPDRQEGTDLECSVIRYKASPGYNELLLLDPTSDVIYPGAVLKGESIATGEYTPINYPRQPLTLSISLQNLEGDISRTVNDPKLSMVRTEINDILQSNVNGATPAKLNFEISEVYSDKQHRLSVGANYQNATASISGSFEFSKQQIQSRVVVKFLQVYYTIDMDLPERPSDLFKSAPDVDQLGSISPMYVSTVSYGRMVLFTATSSETTTDLKAALNAAFDSGITSGDIDISGEYREVIKNSNIKAFVLGGSGEDASGIAVNGIEGLKNYISQGGNYSKDSPGAMLSYKLRFLKDNSIGKVLLASEYNVRQCDQAWFRYEVVMDYIDCSDCEDGNGKYAEMYGKMGVKKFPAPSGEKSWTIDQRVHEDGPGIIEVDQRKVFEFYKPDRKKHYIEIFGNLKEVDNGGSSDENLGSDSEKIYLEDISGFGNYTLVFSREGMTAKAIWQINKK